MKPAILPLLLALHPAYLYATADVDCLRRACMYWPPDKKYTRYAGLNVAPPVPDNVERALLSFEAKGFYDAWPVEPARIRNALWDAFTGWHRVQNTSGIEQQIAKNVFVGNERSLARKYREAVYATKIYFRFSKAETLRIYTALAQTGPDEYGFHEAARVFFRKESGELSLAESMLILQMLPNPQERARKYYMPLCYGLQEWMRQTALELGEEPVQTELDIALLQYSLKENRYYPYAFRHLPPVYDAMAAAGADNDIINN